MHTPFNDRLRQIILLVIILLLAAILLKQLYLFLPGFLGAITLYILTREMYFRCVEIKKWKSTPTALLFIFASLVLIAIPLYFAIDLIAGKISGIISQPGAIIQKGILIGEKLEQQTGYHFLTAENLQSIQKEASVFIPSLLNSSASIISNFAIMFFLFYFLLKSGKRLENSLQQLIPLKEENVRLLSQETRNMIRANAIGIPVLAIIQGIAATIGYRIFGVEDYGLWGFLTGVCSLVPLVGTTIIWIPLSAYFFATGYNVQGLGLLLYSVVFISANDYLIRLTLLKKFMNIHPLITIFGVIVGIGLFGFWGVIFGPLLISYFIILVKIYLNEFVHPTPKNL